MTDETTPTTETPPEVGDEHVAREAPPSRPSVHEADEAPRLLEPAQIRARRRPRALFFVWAFELLCAYVIATPIHAWAKAALGARPDGDAAIFRPGGHVLLSWLGEEGPALGIVLRTTFLLLFVFGVLGQIVTGMLVTSLATGVGERGRAPGTGFALRAGAASFFPLLGVGFLTGALQVFILGMGLLTSSAVDNALTPSAGDARAFTARLVVLALFVVVVLVLGVVGDLARAVVVRNVAAASATLGSTRLRLREAAVRVAGARRALGRATLAWGWRAVISLALIWVGARAGDLVAGRDGGALWLLFAVHQLIILARAGLRASWLANALRLTGD